MHKRTHWRHGRFQVTVFQLTISWFSLSFVSIFQSFLHVTAVLGETGDQGENLTGRDKRDRKTREYRKKLKSNHLF